MADWTADLLDRAIVIWTGYDSTSWPTRSEQRLATALGSEVAASVLPRLHELESAFYESDARNAAGDLVTMGEQASADFRHRHPEISATAVEALAWCYTFDYK